MQVELSHETFLDEKFPSHPPCRGRSCVTLWQKLGINQIIAQMCACNVVKKKKDGEKKYPAVAALPVSGGSVRRDEATLT